MTDLFNIRRDFTLKTLDESDVLSDPMDMFEQWLNEAIIAKALEPNAMNLATATPDGKPSSRMILLKQIKPQGFVFLLIMIARKLIKLH